MKRLKKRHEDFCQNYIYDLNGARAARLAGYSASTARQQAVRLLGREDIRERVRVLRMETARRNCMIPEILMAKLEMVFRQALEYRQCTSAIRAIELQARLAGLLPARTSLGEEEILDMEADMETILPSRILFNAN